MCHKRFMCKGEVDFVYKLSPIICNARSTNGIHMNNGIMICYISLVVLEH